MFAHRIDFLDWCATVDEHAIQLAKFIERDCRIERLFDQRRSSARKQKKNECPLAAARQPIENCPPSGETRFRR
jgi:hypothetical protein